MALDRKNRKTSQGILKEKSDLIRADVEEEISRRGWSRYRLAKEVEGVGVTKGMIDHWLSGKQGIGYDKLEAVCRALGLRLRGEEKSLKPQMDTDKHG